MKKIISLFQRNYDGDRLVRDEVVPGAEWVQAGEGVATRKYDGTCCMVKDCELYARYDVKNGKTPPVGFIPAQDPDPITGHWPGWVKCVRGEKQWRWHFEAWDAVDFKRFGSLRDGTYELCGPKIQSDPEKFGDHILMNAARAFYFAKKEVMRVRKVKASASSEHPKGIRPALTPEARELQLVSLAVDLAEKQLLEGTASSQVITHYLKLGTTRERLEREKLEKENELLIAKTESIKAEQSRGELYAEALKAFQIYSGQPDPDDY